MVELMHWGWDEGEMIPKSCDCTRHTLLSLVFKLLSALHALVVSSYCFFVFFCRGHEEKRERERERMGKRDGY